MIGGWWIFDLIAEDSAKDERRKRKDEWAFKRWGEFITDTFKIINGKPNEENPQNPTWKV